MKSLRLCCAFVAIPALLTVLSPAAYAEDDGGTTTFSVNNSGRDMVDVSGVYSQRQEGKSDLPAPGSSRVELGRSAPPPSADLGCVGQLSAGGWSGADLCPYRFADDEPAEEIPTIDLLYHALAQTQVKGAGLKVEP
ncbi:hypothetical protein [Schaalia sp. Marseille-Q2122]|uniref:hypothetical protein n=1 Tax=Schaalia sp. Marseille-Q2122 TaxID=2736604 RepID=UPI001588FE42|nr:hypothetical protein [Schaalia sp. Marseille-Q2122]